MAQRHFMFVKTQGEGANKILPLLRWIKRAAPAIKQFGFRLKVVPINENTKRRLAPTLDNLKIARLPTLIISMSADDETVALTGTRKIYEFYTELIEAAKADARGGNNSGGRVRRGGGPRGGPGRPPKTVEDENLEDTRELLLSRYGLFDPDDGPEEAIGEGGEKEMLQQYATSMKDRKDRQQKVIARHTGLADDAGDEDEQFTQPANSRHQDESVRYIPKTKPRQDNVSASSGTDDRIGIDEDMLKNAKRRNGGEFNPLDDEMERALWSKNGGDF